MLLFHGNFLGGNSLFPSLAVSGHPMVSQLPSGHWLRGCCRVLCPQGLVLVAV